MGTPAHAWNENFFRKVSQLVGTYISIDESTREKIRLDIARVLVTTSVPGIINSVVEANVNEATYSIRMVEELFADNTNRFVFDWRYQNYEGLSSDEDDSPTNSILMVPETEMMTGLRDEDIIRLHKEISNSKFRNKPPPEVKFLATYRDGSDVGGAGGSEEVQGDLTGNT